MLCGFVLFVPLFTYQKIKENIPVRVCALDARPPPPTTECAVQHTSNHRNT